MTTLKSKPELLQEITGALANSVITPQDLEQFIINPTPTYAQATEADHTSVVEPAQVSRHLSAVDALFYIAGLILFAAIVSTIVQSWEAGDVAWHLFLTLGTGTALWIVAAILARQRQTAILEGLKNALILTGSLSLILGGYIVTNELLGTYDELDFFPFAVTMAVIAVIHLAFDRLMKNSFTLLLGIMLGVFAVPLAFFGILRDIEAPVDAWAVVILLTAGLLAAAARVAGRIYPERPGVSRAFDSFAAFIGLGAMYAASFGDFGVMWLFLLIIGIIGLFYASIIRHEKPLLGSASVFLVIAIITISFRYFSEFGVTVSLVIAALGLLGTAAIATTISKKYFPAKSN